MKTTARPLLLAAAGLALAGCTAPISTPAKPEPAKVAAITDEKPQSVRDHFFMRDIEDKVESTLGNASRR